MDARIILGGQGPDVLGAMGQGNALAAQAIDMRRQGDLSRLYREQGAGIAGGDESAINALAGIDPMAAMGVQRDRLNMDIARRNDGRADQQLQMQQGRHARADANDDRDWQFKMQEYARGLSADDAAAQAAQVEDAVKMGMGIGDAQTWDQIMSQQAPDLVGQFENRQALAQRYMTVAEILKTQAGPAFRPASADEAGQYGAAAGQFGTDGRFYPINPPSGMSIETGPNGEMRIAQGPGAGAGGAKPFTEGQSRDNVYATRAEGALADLEPVADSLASATQRAVNIDPTGVVRGNVQSDEFQRAQNAGDEFLQAILRKDTGAAITAQEQEMYGKTYLPQPGDGPGVLQQKRLARRRALEAMKSGMSPDQLLAQERGLSASGSTTLDAPNAAPQIASPEEYQALPSGAQFTAPDGTVRRKP